MLGNGPFLEEVNQRAKVRGKTGEHKRVVNWAQHGEIASAWTQLLQGVTL
jgi:hypothetical protein